MLDVDLKAGYVSTEELYMLLELSFNQMFTPAKFPLDSNDFQVSRLGGLGFVI